MAFEVKQFNSDYSKLKILILCQGQENLLLKVGKLISEDLDFTDQFDVDLRKSGDSLNYLDSKKLFSQGFSLVSFMSCNSRKKRNLINIVVKDANSNSVLFDKSFEVKDKTVLYDSHSISNELLKTLTGEDGVCLSTLAYCKTVSKKHKVLCMSDYMCHRESVVVSDKTLNIAPSWHTKAPVIFFSQITKSNNRLMSLDLNSRKKNVVCSYEGLNMQPSFSPDGKRAVLCLSGGRGGSDLFLYDQRICSKIGRRVFRQLTKNKANNVSPCMLPSGDVIFCSDYESGLPQIYYLAMKEGRTFRLSNGRGYCAAPSYCEKNNKLVYMRMVKDFFQLFSMSLDNLNNISEVQLTFDNCSKHEPAWSECGRYIACSVEKSGSNPQIGVLNYLSGKMRILTKSSEAKSFPRWKNSVFWV